MPGGAGGDVLWPKRIEWQGHPGKLLFDEVWPGSSVLAPSSDALCS